MRMAIKDGQIMVIEASSTQYLTIKSWGLMKWSKREQMLYAPVTLELLDRLSGIVRLPEPIEEIRQKLSSVSLAVSRERIRDEPVPLYAYPVKLPLYRHQIRGANMALLTMGIIEPPEEGDKRYGEEKKAQTH